MQSPPDRCPNPDCENSLGGQYDPAQFKEIGDGRWECRECGYVRELE